MANPSRLIARLFARISVRVLSTERVMADHFDGLGRNREQAGALLGGQQGAAGHLDLGLMASAFHKALAFERNFETGY